MGHFGCFPESNSHRSGHGQSTNGGHGSDVFPLEVVSWFLFRTARWSVRPFFVGPWAHWLRDLGPLGTDMANQWGLHHGLIHDRNDMNIYPLVNEHKHEMPYGKSQFLVEKLAINSHVQ